MSRSNNQEIKNPAVKFFDWEQTGAFSYFDKSLTDEKNPKGTKVAVPLPFKFVVLDVLATVTGWNDADGTGIYSNEVKDLKTQPLTVKTFKGTEIAKGLYEAVKDRCNSKGGSYTASVYIGFYEGKELKIGHIKFKGAALGAWIEYGKKSSYYKGAITVSSFVEGQKGITRFKMPVFAQSVISETTDELAKTLDGELQEYLNRYFARNNQVNIEKESLKAASDGINQEPLTPVEHYSQEAPELTAADMPHQDDDLPF